MENKTKLLNYHYVSLRPKPLVMFGFKKIVQKKKKDSPFFYKVYNDYKPTDGPSPPPESTTKAQNSSFAYSKSEDCF